MKSRSRELAPLLPEEDACRRAEILKALAHPVRIQIVDLLAGRETCLCELAPLFRIHLANLSRHLSILKRVGVVREERRGRRRMLSILTPCIVQALECAAKAVTPASHRPPRRPQLRR